MGYAFEVTPDDVRGLLFLHGIEPDATEVQRIFDEFIVPEDGRIEEAALYGSDMDEQLDYALAEMTVILTEAGILEKGYR